jgi:hypothetical protein
MAVSLKKESGRSYQNGREPESVFLLDVPVRAFDQLDVLLLQLVVDVLQLGSML